MNVLPMQDKAVLITGANSGIGKAAATELARQGARVIMVCRDQARGRASLADIRRASGSDSVDLMLADLGSQAQIRALADLVHASYTRLDVLINNAGAMHRQRRLTEDGLETTFAVNHLAPFLLTHLLLDLLKASAPSRVITISSQMHAWTDWDLGNLQGERSYAGETAYSLSKLANVMFTYALARRLAGTGVTANCLHPGVVATNFFGPTSGRKASSWMLTPSQGADTVVYLATAPEVATVTGQYFVNRQPQRTSEVSYDEGAQRHLWALSARLTGIDAKERLG